MNGIVGLKDLCSPAYVYLVISISALIVMTVQNLGNADKYCLGTPCSSHNKQFDKSVITGTGGTS